MENDVADYIGADVILPKSAMKPALPEKSVLGSGLNYSAVGNSQNERR